ncbi:3-hydroxyisobutyryl-CoA hydrolase [Leucobacter sp. USHLN153]|uniref:3-hydroxyisobutyryl-CoA hydrolase n=1 Tax=Leucobacter sp. USHLN153 TaxID=3081268 RepID=UPI00301B15C7
MSHAEPHRDPQPTPEPLVLARRDGAVTHLTLNRPRAINALSSEMFSLLDEAITRVQTDGSEAILLDGAGERGFCGGGDIKEISGGNGRRILATEYRVDHALAVSAVPVVAVMDGIAMGGGIGLGGHARVRVVTERSRLAMPEVRIGIVPDVGGHLLLARAPGRLGELLAVTAGEMSGADAIALGFADYFVPSERLGALREALVAGEEPGAVARRLAEAAPTSELLDAASWWEPLLETAVERAGGSAFRAPKQTALHLVALLEEESHARRSAVAATMRAMSPTSIAVTLAQLERTRERSLDLAAVLADDLRVLGRLDDLPDFAEGVRAQIIDKDRAPRWSPASLEDLNDEVLARILDPEPRVGEAPLVL